MELWEKCTDMPSSFNLELELRFFMPKVILLREEHRHAAIDRYWGGFRIQISRVVTSKDKQISWEVSIHAPINI